MRNKVKNLYAARLLAFMLIMVLSAGTFSVSVFAETDPAEAASAETAVQENTQGSAQEKSINTAAPDSKETGSAESEQIKAPEKTDTVSEGSSEKSPASDEAAGTSEPAASAPASPEASQPSADTAGEDASVGSSDADLTSGSSSDADVTANTSPAEADAALNAASDLQSTAKAADDQAAPEAGTEAAPAAPKLKAAARNPQLVYAPPVEPNQPVQTDTDSSETEVVDLTIPKYELTINTNGSDVPDNFSMTLTTTSAGVVQTHTIKKSDVNPTILSLAEGAVLVVDQVTGLTDEYQQGDRPIGNKQLRLVFSRDNGIFFEIALNNSELMKDDFTYRSDTEALFRMPPYSVSANVMTAFRNRVRPAESEYNRGICVISNLSDKTCEFADIYALPGQKIQVGIEYDNYDQVDLSVTDSSGNAIPVSNGIFTMPDAPSIISVVYYYRPIAVTVKNSKPERGSVSTDKNEYRPGEKVIVNVDASNGYAPKSVLMLYTVNGKIQATRLEKDDYGQYSFIMPFYSVTLNAVFSETSSSGSGSGSASASGNVSYAAAAAVPQEPAAAEQTQPELTDVMPAVAAVVANTMLVVTTTVNMM